jgi:radical SAM superfamily enzyme YgiQ (UPF0313 family)
MHILLISPADKRLKVKRLGERSKVSWMYRSGRVSLLAVADATPEEHAIRFLDEHVEPVNYNIHADVVGVSFSTPLAHRAYEIGDEFRRRGVPVIFGGYHPTFLPDEALEHCDAVCIGEAEPVWPRMLHDLENWKLGRSYHSVARTDLMRSRPLRRTQWDSDSHEILNVVVTGRGCPHACDFCSVTEFFGNTYRHRPVDEIVKEVESLGDRLVHFGDDNIVADRVFAAELFRAMVPLKKHWMGQATLSIADDPELVKLAGRSGCSGLFIGLESLARENLEASGKGFNDTARYTDSIKTLTDEGIAVLAGFVFGFDHDDYRVFDRTVKFIKETNLIATQIAILTPFPGTRLYDRLESEKRIFDRDWRKYDYRHVVFSPKRMTAPELQDGTDWAIGETYSLTSLALKAYDLIPVLGPRELFRYALPMNLACRRDLLNRNSPRGFRRVQRMATPSVSS